LLIIFNLHFFFSEIAKTFNSIDIEEI
jgi:hypothetical protein